MKTGEHWGVLKIRWSLSVIVLALSVVTGCGDPETTLADAIDDAGIDATQDGGGDGLGPDGADDGDAQIADGDSGPDVNVTGDGEGEGDGDGDADGDADVAPPTPCTSSVECDEALSPLPPCRRAQCGTDGLCTTTAKPDLTPCDDGDSCTTGDKCAAGVCEGGFNTCACDQDSDCTALDDGNKCNGLWTCTAGTCAFDPSTVVPCGDDQCNAGSCNPATGVCTSIPDANGTACDDGSVCTTVDSCQGGSCTGAGALDCGPPPVCQQAICDPIDGCTLQNVDGGGCDDGDACTAADVCEAGQCAGTPITCLASGPCLVASCDPQTGCSEGPLGDGTTCDDDNPCTDSDLCSGGQCAGEASCECATDDDCPEVPGNLCLTFTCEAGKCQPEPPKVCNQNPNPCVRAECLPSTGQCGLVELSNGALCDAGPCLVGGKCIDATCEAAPQNCDDGNDCTTDTCDVDQGCLSAPAIGQACEDGEPCTVDDTCDDAGQCTSGPANPCDDGDQCTADSCVPGVGCQNVDASACDDGDLCTTDLCDPAIGCVHNPKICFGQVEGCLIPSCVLETGECGLGPAPSGFNCDDGDACTEQDGCQAGDCLGQAVDCDDGDSCTADSCDSAAGCQHAPIPNCTP